MRLFNLFSSDWKSAWAQPDARWFLAWILLCLPWLTGIKVIPFDAVEQFFPAVSFTAEQLRHWLAPWWNPYLYGGNPQLADPQMMTFQPTVVLPMLLAPGSLHLFNVVILLHILVGGFAGIRLAREMGLLPLPQVVFALVLMFGGVAAARLQHTPMIVTYSMLPWLWLGLFRLHKHGRIRDSLLAGFAGGLGALQLTQVTYIFILTSAVYATIIFVMAGSQRLRIITQLALAGLLAGLISSPQWLSTLSWLSETNRGHFNLDTAVHGALQWQSLTTLLSGNVFSQGRGDSWAFGDITTDYLYFGAVPLLVWLAWGGEVARQQPVKATTALAVFVFGVLIALGEATPLFPFLFEWLPGLSLFRRPSDALFLTSPAAAWLSGHALNVALKERRLSPHYPSVLVVSVLLGLAVWLAVINHRPTAFVWLTLSVVIGALALYRLRRAADPVRWFLPLILLDLMIFNMGTSFNSRSGTGSDLTADRARPAQSAYAFLSQQTSDGLPERSLVFGLGLLTNGAAAHGLPLANGYNPMVARDYQVMTGLPEAPMPTPQQMPTTPWTPGLNAQLLDLIGVRWVLSSTPFPDSVAYDGQVEVATRSTVLPRVLNPRQVVRHDARYPPAGAFNETDFTTTLWLPANAGNEKCSDMQGGIVAVTAQQVRPSTVQLDVYADDAGWIVVNEVTATGWVASLEDGTPLSVLRGNGLFRALCIPPGEHRVYMHYSPFQLWLDGLGKYLFNIFGLARVT